jgi:ataxia telangiectasia mutated family protein
MTDVSRAALQQTATGATLKPYWTSAWQSASRAATSLSTCRAACHLMDVLLKLQIVPFSAVSDNVLAPFHRIERSGIAC